LGCFQKKGRDDIKDIELARQKGYPVIAEDKGGWFSGPNSCLVSHATTEDEVRLVNPKNLGRGPDADFHTIGLKGNDDFEVDNAFTFDYKCLSENNLRSRQQESSEESGTR